MKNLDATGCRAETEGMRRDETVQGNQKMLLYNQIHICKTKYHVMKTLDCFVLGMHDLYIHYAC